MRFCCCLLFCVCCGCAAIYSHREDQRQYLDIKDKISITDEHGDRVQVYRQFDRFFILPGDSIHELSFVRKGHKRVVPLQRNTSGLLVLDGICGLYPLVIDDAFGSGFYFDDIDPDTVTDSIPSYKERAWPRVIF